MLNQNLKLPPMDIVLVDSGEHVVIIGVSLQIGRHLGHGFAVQKIAVILFLQPLAVFRAGLGQHYIRR